MAVDEAQEIVEHKLSNSNRHTHSNGNQQRKALDLSHHLSAESVARRVRQIVFLKDVDSIISHLH